MLNDITPVLLTLNEASNIERTLSHLAWARDIVVVDSGSTDATLSILARHPNVRVFTRAFDNHMAQWMYAVNETAIATPWILRLDADYQLSPRFVDEIAALPLDADAYRVLFDYAIFATPLRASLYPPNTLLLRRGRFRVVDKGHTEGWHVEGPVRTLRSHILHDDRKSTRHWLAAQAHYMARERDRLATKRSGMRDWLRLHPPLAPFAMFLYCLFGKGLIFSGRAGLFYSLQRMVAEAALALMVLEESLRTGAGLDDRAGHG